MQRILVVEDDFDIQELLQNFLQEAGYEVATANDGIEALSLFSGQRYDLIILDILLPKIDGYGVCELIRKQSDVPIIMLTALSGEEDQIRDWICRWMTILQSLFLCQSYFAKLQLYFGVASGEKMKSLKSSLMAIYF